MRLKLAWRLIGCTALFLAHTSLRAATYIQGIDVYSGDGSVNWTSVKNAGYSFAFVKATEGVNFVDSRFTTNMTSANNAGVYVGPYHFARPDSKNGVAFTSYDGGPLSPNSPNQTNRDAYADATSEAADFLDAIRPYYLKTGNTRFLRPVADVEGSAIPNFATTALEKTFVSNWVQIFSDTILADLGVRPILYTGKSTANTYFTSTIAAEQPLWLAWYRGTGTTQPPVQSDTPVFPAWSFWQWSDGTDSVAKSNLVPGVSGSPDRDVFSGTLSDLSAMRLQIVPEPSACAMGWIAALFLAGRRARFVRRSLLSAR
ncbi:MAG TPA: glycoside hydrolase family 25 protein [Tepidisphaeraceae bacterium]|jgi:GH25 family lysozyme M1 (1,4-beta-N-acetylmuramidase)